MDTQPIIATVLDYFEGWFEGDATRMERALHPELAKRGVKAGVVHSMTAPQMIGWTRDGEGPREKPADPAIRITVTEVFQDIACVVVHSAIYIEYLQLARTPAGWRIVNALYMRV
jgi:Putative lumazine-binding